VAYVNGAWWWLAAGTQKLETTIALQGHFTVLYRITAGYSYYFSHGSNGQKPLLGLRWVPFADIYRGD